MSPLLGTAFAAFERLGSKPRVLFTIAVGARIWRYAQAARDVTVTATGLTYKAAQIEVDGDVERREETGPQRISVRMSNRLDVVSVLKETGSEPRFIGIHRYHPAAGGSPARWAYGQIVSFRRTRGAVIIELLTEEGAWDGIVPRSIYSTQCQKDTYTPECGIRAEDFSSVCNVTAYDGITVTVDSVSGKPDNYFSQGILRIGNRFWHVTSQVGTALKIFGKIAASVTFPAAALIYAGDDLTHETCRDKFANLINFLGFKWLPSQDPTIDLEHRGPDAVVAVIPTPDPPAYSRPAKFIWYKGDVATLDGALNVQTWPDGSGNGRDGFSSDARTRPGYRAPDITAPIPFHETGYLACGPAASTQPIGHNGAGDLEGGTVISLPSLASLTETEIFLALNLTEYPVKKTRLIMGGAWGETQLSPDGTVVDNLGLHSGGNGPMVYRMPDLKAGGIHVLNWTLTAARWTVRLDGVPLFTTLPIDHGYVLSFTSFGGQIGGINGGGLYLPGYMYRFLMYPAELNNADRATCLQYMQTGAGAPV